MKELYLVSSFLVHVPRCACHVTNDLHLLVVLKIAVPVFVSKEASSGSLGGIGVSAKAEVWSNQTKL